MDQPAPVARIDVISDAICPWCYIGKRQLEGALEILAKDGLTFNVVWNPFQLNPDMPVEGVDRKAYREAKFGGPERARQIDQRVTDAAAGVGLDYHLDRLTRTPNTVNAHRLIRMAGLHGVQNAVVEAMFDAYFCNGADLGDVETLAEIGARGGLKRDEVIAMLASEDNLKEVLSTDQMARNAGIQGVPSFALQGHVLFSGAVPAADMADAFRRAWDVLKTKAA
ncbi:MAG TPA: DsbA family oxidoreductase [Reyranella sp.]|jgi:predicted DsbA family dithiol-disulfide isomerase|nr:DsbA family oxidoreductase [Reyranella sp.]